MQHGEVREYFTQELHRSLEKIINAKSKRDRPYYMLITFNDGYDGKPAGKTSNHLLHGESTPIESGEKTMDLSDKRVAKQTIVLMEPERVAKMPPLINTSLWYVDNKKGIVRCVYILPPDKPMIHGFDIADESELVFNCGQHAPIVY